MVKEGIKIRRGKQLGYGSLNEGEGRIYDVQMLDIMPYVRNWILNAMPMPTRVGVTG